MATDRRAFLKGALAGTGVCLLGGPGVLASTFTDGFGENVAMLNDCTRCTGCRACQNVCREDQGYPALGPDEKYDMPLGLDASHYTTIKLYAEGEKHSFVKRQCMHCNHPSCVSACPVTALQKQKSGHVTYDPGKCIGCRYCMIACPFNVPRFNFDDPAPEIRKCNFCKDRLRQGKTTLCAEICPTGAIQFGTRNEMLKLARQRMNAEPARYVQHIYGEEEVGGTSVLYLSGVPFEKLGLRPFGDEPLPQCRQSLV